MGILVGIKQSHIFGEFAIRKVGNKGKQEGAELFDGDTAAVVSVKEEEDLLYLIYSLLKLRLILSK